MSKNSILTHSSDFFTDLDLILSSWSLINKGNILYVSVCEMGPVKNKSKQSLQLSTQLIS